MDKKLDFAHYLILLTGVREKQILHDLSNKFNLLTLAIEDLEEAVDETPQEKSTWKEVIGEEVSSLRVAKSKFEELANLLKEEVSSKKGSLRSIFDLAKSCLQKELRNKNINIEVNAELEQEVAFDCGLKLICGVILLRTLLDNDGESTYTFDFNNKNALISGEKEFLKKMAHLIDTSFESIYISLITSLFDRALS